MRMVRGCAARVCRIRDHYRRRIKRVWLCDSLNVDDICDDKSIQRRAVAPLDAECVSEIRTHDRVPSLRTFTRHSHAHKGCKKIHLPKHSTPHRASSSSSSSTHASTTRRTRRARARQALVSRTHRARSRRTSPLHSRARMRNHERTPAHDIAHVTAHDALTTRLLAHSAAYSTPESLR